MPDPDQEPADAPLPAWAGLHLWQIQWIRDLSGVAILIGLLLLGERLSLVTVPLLLALLFAYLFEPLIGGMTRRWNVSRRLAAGTMVVSCVIFLALPAVLALGFGVLQGVTFAGGLAEKTSSLIASVDEPTDDGLREAIGGGPWLRTRDLLVDLRTDDTPDADDEIEVLGIDRATFSQGIDVAIGWVRDNAHVLAVTALEKGRGAVLTAVSVLASLGKLAFGAFLTVFFLFFIAAGWPDLLHFGERLFPVGQRGRSVEILQQMNRAIHGFIRGRLTIGVALGVFYTVGFWLIGVPAPLILGPAVAFITLIPYAALMAVPVIMVLLWLEGHTGLRGNIWWVLLAPFAWYQIGQALDDYVLTPLIQGKSTDLDTPTILFASISGGLLLGIFGLLVAIPLAACLKILVKELFWPRALDWLKSVQKGVVPDEPSG
jgi:predicted PurR-regulated permease PerM